jgi:hypothetical protein
MRMHVIINNICVYIMRYVVITFKCMDNVIIIRIHIVIESIKYGYYLISAYKVIDVLSLEINCNSSF